jgi:hypothetical protein
MLSIVYISNDFWDKNLRGVNSKLKWPGKDWTHPVNDEDIEAVFFKHHVWDNSKKLEKELYGC